MTEAVDIAAELAEVKAELAQLRQAVVAILNSNPMKMAGLINPIASIRNTTEAKKAPKKITGNRDLMPPLVFGPNGVKR